MSFRLQHHLEVLKYFFVVVITIGNMCFLLLGVHCAGAEHNHLITSPSLYASTYLTHDHEAVHLNLGASY